MEVLWAQRFDRVLVRVCVVQARDVSVHMDDASVEVTFEAQGRARRISLHFPHAICTDDSQHKHTEREIQLTLVKKEHSWWDTLGSGARAKVDFDRWCEEDDAVYLGNGSFDTIGSESDDEFT